jgi:hypothetical protein
MKKSIVLASMLFLLSTPSFATYYLACFNNDYRGEWDWGPSPTEPEKSPWIEGNFIQSYKSWTILLGDYWSEDRGFYINNPFKSLGDATSFCKSLQTQCHDATQPQRSSFGVKKYPTEIVPVDAIHVTYLKGNGDDAYQSCDELVR